MAEPPNSLPAPTPPFACSSTQPMSAKLDAGTIAARAGQLKVSITPSMNCSNNPENKMVNQSSRNATPSISSIVDFMAYSIGIR